MFHRLFTKFAGWTGETAVRFRIGKSTPPSQYVIYNYQVETENTSTQIDHIVINENGIFVIETKNYSGRIYGSEDQLKWTQVLAYGKVKNSFYNPIKQNDTHIWRLRKILGSLVKQVPFHNFVVFLEENTYKISSSHLVSLSELKKALQKSNPDGKKLTTDEITEIYHALIDYQDTHIIGNRTHVKNIKKMQKKIDNNICPRCGHDLVKRNGKNGAFLGCSSFPACKFTKNI